jgi:hypothetical protein
MDFVRDFAVAGKLGCPLPMPADSAFHSAVRANDPVDECARDFIDFISDGPS